MSPPAAQARTCAACGAVATDDALFCEACGTDLPTPVRATRDVAKGPAADVLGGEVDGARAQVCLECGHPVVQDGYCASCGAKAPLPRDHMVERPRSWVAGVSDRGRRHHRNEDAMALAADEDPGSRAVLVVCDGVSSSQDSDVAALAAARAARDVLLAPGARGMDTGSGLTAVMGARIEAATDAASEAVTGATSAEHGDSPPSCTFVCAVLDRGRVVVGVVGDSRAYWLPDAGEARALTVDDSWAAEQIAAGQTRAAAESGAQAHAITRWLGVDAPDHSPRLTSFVVDGPGWLLLCSDGLWNYCSEAVAMAEVVRQSATAAGGELLATASELVAWANSQGGHDNITVVLARLGTEVPVPVIDETDGGDPR